MKLKLFLLVLFSSFITQLSAQQISSEPNNSRHYIFLEYTFGNYTNKPDFNGISGLNLGAYVSEDGIGIKLNAGFDNAQNDKIIFSTNDSINNGISNLGLSFGLDYYLIKRGFFKPFIGVELGCMLRVDNYKYKDLNKPDDVFLNIRFPIKVSTGFFLTLRDLPISLYYRFQLGYARDERLILSMIGVRYSID